MTSELTFIIKGEEKTLRKRVGPFHSPIVMSSDDETIRKQIDEMIAEFNAPVDDVIVTCKMTL